ncbi:MAG: serine/threonine-protein phosphatase [Solirubrobacterales bacterium]|nr:serine/threonine-protein phosphatase [Solirubrobacterales bacterium]
MAMTDSHPTSVAVAEAAEDTEGPGQGGEASSRRPAGGWPYWVAIAVGAVGLVATGVLVWISASTYTSNENRLLSLRARDAGALITGALPTTQIPLASAAALADATDGDVAKFKAFIARSVGPQGTGQFVSVSLWNLGAGQPRQLAVVGAPPVLAASTARLASFFMRAPRTGQLAVIGLLAEPHPRLGYAFTSPGLTGRYVAYAESALPANRRSRFQSSSSFADLDYALYLGRSQLDSNLLVSDLRNLPIQGRHASVTIPFGDTVLTFVVTPRRPLAGTFAQRLPWLVAIIGLLLSLGAAALTARLIGRRKQAERLARSLELIADENRRLYAEQRTIARTLQHALLPERLPTVRGVETSARYETGVKGIDIGGDWYDLIALDERRLLLVVGDVSGRGVRAAATMAALRFAIHAYAAQDDPPDEILTKLSSLVNVGRSGQLATVLCALVDIEARRLTVTSAGHLPPLLISDGTGTFVHSEVGVPIGVRAGATYASTSIDTPPAATLLAFTDGLVERRGESIDTGLARLQHAASSNHAQLDDLLGRLLDDLRLDGGEDDTAIAALRWLD